ncbi:helix-turn-helix domain-containing protein [Sphingorhabdus sp.]|jgi:transcriptional regulator with XRE-family HTH domain|uniref:helix-turn-helix domain-containing protein n=1 Tax=Sphingorhabdus sp. TaxID=1902408 RepID=UPI003D812D9E
MPRKTLPEYPNRVRFWRDQARLKQEDLGKLVGLSKVQISRIEIGQRDLNFGYARRIAAALGVTTAELLNELDNPVAADPTLHEINKNYRLATDEGRYTISVVAESSAKYQAERQIHDAISRVTLCDEELN